MRAVDTNVLVRLATRDDEAQVVAAEAFIAPGAWVSQIVLVETMWVLGSVYGLDATAIARAVELLLSHESLAVDGSETVRAALATFRDRPRLGFSDCLILASARKAGHLPLGSFDRDLAKIDGTHRL